MKKIFLILFSAAITALTISCGEDELTPKVDASNEYEAKLAARANNTVADAIIYDWYKKYGTAFVYDFTGKEFSWLWASKLTDSYEQFDMTNPDDVAKYQDFVEKIRTDFIASFSEERLTTTLPRRVFLCKKLNPTSSAVSDNDTVASSNGQDAILVGYEGRSGVAFAADQISNSMTKAFASFFYSKLPVPPTAFLESQTKCNYSLVTAPADPKIEAEFKTVAPVSTDANSFDYKNHKANVCGFIRAYLFTYVKLPTEEQDFADYYAFLACSSSERIRLYCSRYWRIAMRSQLFLEYWKENMGEDLLEVHNRRYPDDPLTIRDFKY